MTRSERRQYWHNIIQQWRDSGLSKTHFCATHQIDKSNFYNWLKKLSPDDIRSKPSSEPPAFVALSHKPASPSDQISLTVGSLQLQFPAASLGSVLIQLKKEALIDAQAR